MNGVVFRVVTPGPRTAGAQGAVTILKTMYRRATAGCVILAAGLLAGPPSGNGCFAVAQPALSAVPPAASRPGSSGQWAVLGHRWVGAGALLGRQCRFSATCGTAGWAACATRARSACGHQPFTVTFAGEVNPALHNRVPLGESIRSSAIPQSGLLATQLGCPPFGPGAQVIRLTDPRGAYTVYTLDEDGWSPAEPVIEIGEAFWCRNLINAFAWNRVLH